MYSRSLQKALNRRALMRMGVGGILIAATPLPALAEPADLIQAQKSLFGDRPIREGRVTAVSTRIRLGGTQTVQAVAEFSDGSLWSGSAKTVVTLAACVVL